MNIKKIVSGLVAASLAATMQSFVFAEENVFATATDFLTDVVNTSVSGITSSTMGNAISYVQSKFSTVDGVVSYNGTEIGYWDSYNSSTLYADATKSSIVIKPSASGYEVDPSFLSTVLPDVNSQLVETYTPATSDWSKIIGKYDVTLGDVTIPAKQWVEVTPSTKPHSDNSNLVNISAITGVTGLNIGTAFSSNNIFTLAWIVDENGNLYLQNTMQQIFVPATAFSSNVYCIDSTTVSTRTVYDSGNWEKSAYIDTAPNIQVGLLTSNSSTAAASSHIYFTNTTNSKLYQNGRYDQNSSVCRLYKIGDPSTKNTTAIVDSKKSGIVYLLGNQIDKTTTSETLSTFNEMFMYYSASKTVEGNAKLSKRISKLPGLSASDVLTISSTGWTINGTEDFDTFFTTQQVENAGDIVDISTVADIEPLQFNVVVPTTLPVYIDAAGIVSVASNAKVVNNSNASVKFTDIEIVAKDTSGWTLVDSNPSPVRDAKEFSLKTSLEVDTVLSKDEVLPFTYTPKLSPLTEGADALDLASVYLTIDWAD